EGLRRLHALKTGRLLRAGVTTATAVAGLTEEARAPWRSFGDELGVLFQIVDDILDATGTAEELGKTPGKDEAAGKLTYVSLHGLERARELADDAQARVEERLASLPGDTSVLAELVAAIHDRHS
ncbi:MAG TPA: polyprenyl synthetase family protein, partial [Gaiellaceae bacterium]|nr:polyprenyl synthetase family protein [Gaiellaceae bacterium]